MDEGAILVTRPGKWGNPFRVGHEAKTREEAVRMFRDMLSDDRARAARGYPSVDQIVKALRGRSLACFCPLDEPCHADVLLEIANQ